MEDTHDLGGTTVAVDRATPKEDDHPPRPAPVARMSRPPVTVAGGFGAPGGYGAYDAYISAATRYAALGAPTLYDNPASFYGSKLTISIPYFRTIFFSELFKGIFTLT